MAVLDTVKREIEKMQNSVKREYSTENRILNLTVVLEAIAQKVEASEPLPPDTNYTSYEEWQRDVEEDLRSARSSLATLEEYKDLIVALDMYVENQGV